MVYDNAGVCGTAKVCGTTKVCGNAIICGNVTISDSNQIFNIDNIGNRNATATFVKYNGYIYVTYGCFHGTVDEFEKAVEKMHGDNIHGKTYKNAIDRAKVHLTY